MSGPSGRASLALSDNTFQAKLAGVTEDSSNIIIIEMLIEAKCRVRPWLGPRQAWLYALRVDRDAVG